MAIDAAINKAWDDLKQKYNVRTMQTVFFGEDYIIDLEKKEVVNETSGVRLKDYHSLLVLHYLLKQDAAGVEEGQWISFRDLEGGEFYYSVFRKRALEHIIKKYSNNIGGILKDISRIGAEKIDMADTAILVRAFQKVPIAVLLWKQDDELPGDANILFKENIKDIFCTEDVAVLAEIVASKV